MLDLVDEGAEEEEVNASVVGAKVKLSSSSEDEEAAVGIEVRPPKVKVSETGVLVTPPPPPLKVGTMGPSSQILPIGQQAVAVQ